MTLTLRRPAYSTFEQRCQALSVLTWWCDLQGAIIAEPVLEPELQAWLNAPRLRHRIETAARSLLHSQACDAAEEIFPGCTLILIASRRAADAGGVAASMVMTPRFAQSEAFAAICKQAALPVEEAVVKLGAWMAHHVDSGAMLHRTLVWMHEDLLGNQRHEKAISEFSESLLQSFEQTHLLFRLARLLNTRHDPVMMIEMVCRQIQPVLPFGWIALKFGTASCVLESLADKLIVAGGLPCDQERFNALAQAMTQRSHSDDWTRLLDPADHELAALVKAEIVAELITHDDEPIGVLLAGNKGGDDPDVSSGEMQFLEATADFLGVFHENMARFSEQQALFMGTLGALTASIDAKDRYTCGHSERVAHLASRIAAALGMDEEQVERVRISGLVHDVGKIGVPEAVLCKPGRLTDEEFELIKLHPVIGYNILTDIGALADVLPGVLHHHERWDGRGYPHGIAGEAIPLLGRIIAVADTFDAMTSTRSYRSAMPHDRVMAELRRCKGSQFDARMVEAFEAVDLTEYRAMVERHQAAQTQAA